jgi:Family of unknown function (DUF6502)
MTDIKLAASAALSEVFEQVASLALLAHMGTGECVQIFEGAMVRAAARVFLEEDRARPTVTQLAARTGLTSKKVREYQRSEGSLPQVVRHQSRYSRVIYGWRTDPRFSTGEDQPRVLPLRGKGSFADLVRIWGKQERTKPVLEELLYHEMVKIVDGKSIQLLVNQPAGKIAPQDLTELGHSVSVLIEALRRQLDQPDGMVGQFFRRISNVQFKPEEVPGQTRDYARQAESFANSLATFIQDPSMTLRPASEPRAAESVHLLVCVTHHPVVVPPIGEIGSRGTGSPEKKRSTSPGRRATKK